MWGPKRWNASVECRDTRVFSHVGSAPTGLQLAFRLSFCRLPSDGTPGSRGWDLARWDLRAKGLGIAHPAVPSVFGVRGLVVRILPPTPSPRQISQLLFPHAVGCRRENHQLGQRLS